MITAHRFHELLVQSAQGRVRVDQELLWRTLHALHPEITVTTSARRKLNELVEQLVQDRLVELPRGRAGWDNSSAPPLPRWVRFCTHTQQRKARDLRSIPWAPEMRFLVSARVDLEINDLLQLQRFFAEGGRDLPIVPIKERSLQIFGQEKRLDNIYSSSALFGTGRLSLEQLRCTVVPEPLGWKRGPTPDGPIIVIENVATWHSYCRWNDLIRTFSAVVYGGGNRFVESVTFLTDIIIEIGGVRDVVYFGDLDPPGLSIPQRATQRALKLGLPEVKPHGLSYQWLLQSDGAVDDPDAFPDRESCKWLGDLSEAAWLILSSRRRIPQERIGWEFLMRQIDGIVFSRGKAQSG